MENAKNNIFIIFIFFKKNIASILQKNIIIDIKKIFKNLVLNIIKYFLNRI